MAPLPPNGTPRYKVNYTITSFQHSFQVRSHVSPSAIGTFLDAFLTALADALYGLIVQTVEFAADGSDIFLPVATGIEGNVYSVGSPTVTEVPHFYGFIGRSAAGRKWHLDVFGARTLGIDYRLNAGENADVDAAIAVLQGAGATLVGIDDAVVTVYGYANCGANAHFQRKVR
jgi:hypothetical protein